MMQPWIPQDGSPPFFSEARNDRENYESEDEYDDDTWQPPQGFQWGEDRTQMIPAVTPVSTDTRFIWQSYQPSKKDRMCRRGFAVKDADTAILLSGDEADTLLLPSELLKASHPFFEAAFSKRWLHNKIVEDTPATAALIAFGVKYILELELDSDGETSLAGKNAPTPVREYRAKWDKANEAYRSPGFVNIFDDCLANSYAQGTLYMPEHHNICMAAHKVGFAMMCGFTPRINRHNAQAISQSGDLTVLLQKVIEVAHKYSSIKTMGPQIERFVLTTYRTRYQQEISSLPYVYLRFATIIKSKHLFNLALEYSTERYLNNRRVYSNEYSNGRDDHEDLVTSLGHDYLLIDHVQRMYAKMLSLLHGTHTKISASAISKLHPVTTSRMATDIFRASYQHITRVICGGDVGKAVREIAEGQQSAKDMIEEYARLRYKKQGFPPKHIDEACLKIRVQALIDCAQEEAQALCNERGTFIGAWGGRGWALAGMLDFTDYVYPWQIKVGAPSAMTCLADAVAATELDDDEEEDGEEDTGRAADWDAEGADWDDGPLTGDAATNW